MTSSEWIAGCMNRAQAHAPTLLFGLVALACLLRALFPPALDSAAPPPLCRIDQPCRFAPIRRAVILPNVLDQWLTFAGGSQRVLAASTYGLAQVRMTALGHIFPGVNHIRELGNRASGGALDDPESLLLLAPDAVLVWAWQADAYEQAGLPVVEMDNTDRSDELMTAQWRRVAALAGAAGRAERLIAADAVNRQSVVTRTARLGEGTHRPSVLIVRRGRQGGMFWPIGWRFLVTKQVPVLGGVDVTRFYEEHGGGLNTEELYVMDPDIIILPSWGLDGSSADADPGDLYADAAMQPLAAVKHRRIYRSPLFWPEMSGLAERALMMRWMAELMYPRQLQHRLRALFRWSYQDIYGYTLSDDEIDEIIRLDKNRGSVGFGRFAREPAGGGG